MSGNESFWGRNIIDGGSGDREGIKPIEELLLGTLGGGGGGVHNVPSSFDLHCRKVSWQREKIARWQLHASSQGRPLTQLGYLPSGISKNVKGLFK